MKTTTAKIRTRTGAKKEQGIKAELREEQLKAA